MLCEILKYSLLATSHVTHKSYCKHLTKFKSTFRQPLIVKKCVGMPQSVGLKLSKEIAYSKRRTVSKRNFSSAFGFLIQIGLKKLCIPVFVGRNSIFFLFIIFLNNFLAFFSWIKPIWAADKQVKMVFLKNSLSRRYLNVKFAPRRLTLWGVEIFLIS